MGIAIVDSFGYCNAYKGGEKYDTENHYADMHGDSYRRHHRRMQSDESLQGWHAPNHKRMGTISL